MTGGNHPDLPGFYLEPTVVDGLRQDDEMVQNEMFGPVSAAMRFGCVWINDHLPFVSEMPHGGFKQPGYGKDLSMYGLEDDTVVKHVMASLS